MMLLKVTVMRSVGARVYRVLTHITISHVLSGLCHWCVGDGNGIGSVGKRQGLGFLSERSRHLVSVPLISCCHRPRPCLSELAWSFFFNLQRCCLFSHHHKEVTVFAGDEPNFLIYLHSVT
jgi:hypothetical protein